MPIGAALIQLSLHLLAAGTQAPDDLRLAALPQSVRGSPLLLAPLERLGPPGELAERPLRGRLIDALAKAREGVLGRLLRTPRGVLPDIREDPAPVGRLRDRHAIGKARVLKHDDALFPLARAKRVAVARSHLGEEIERLPVSLQSLDALREFNDPSIRGRSTDGVAKAHESPFGRLVRTPGSVVPNVGVHRAPVGRSRDRHPIAQMGVFEHGDPGATVARV